jgi:hypothetical protein
LQDEGSTNGTFFGLDKVNCKSSPQIITDGSLLYLGKEPFLAKFVLKSVDVSRQKKETPAQPSTISRKHRCNEPYCGYETENPPDVCPKCRAFKSFVPTVELDERQTLDWQ